MNETFLTLPWNLIQIPYWQCQSTPPSYIGHIFELPQTWWECQKISIALSWTVTCKPRHESRSCSACRKDHFNVFKVFIFFKFSKFSGSQHLSDFQTFLFNCTMHMTPWNKTFFIFNANEYAFSFQNKRFRLNLQRRLSASGSAAPDFSAAGRQTFRSFDIKGQDVE